MLIYQKIYHGNICEILEICVPWSKYVEICGTYMEMWGNKRSVVEIFGDCQLQSSHFGPRGTSGSLFEPIGEPCSYNYHKP